MSKLKIELDSKSYFLKDHIDFEVRDGSMKLVDRISASEYRDIQLSPGLYQVSAVLQDGQNHIQLVDMGEDQTVTFQLDSGVEQFRSGDDDEGLAGYRRPVKPAGVRGLAGAIVTSGVSLREVRHAVLHEQSENQWIFEPEGEEAIPQALFEAGDTTHLVSLPTNPRREYPFNACSIEFEYGRPHCWMSPDRAVGNTLQHWLLNGQISRAAGIAGEATGLLRDKYQDPTAALLGALILFRFDRLEEREDWLGNLAGDFPWLTDGVLLRTALEARKQGPSLQLLESIVELSSHPILFTETYSILIDLLRRWPGRKDAEPAFEEQRVDALESLAERTVNVDWSALSLTVSQSFEEQEAIIDAEA